MTTIINSNGSKWASEAPDTINDLLKVLASHPLDRRFEDGGNFIYDETRPGVPRGMARFWGNFLTVSHVFNITTNEPDVIEKLTEAIRQNQQRADYLIQPDPVKPEPKSVREFSPAGPCLILGEFVRRTAKTITYREWLGGDNYGDECKRGGWKVEGNYIHTEPCRSCRDHPETSYPNGYMD